MKEDFSFSGNSLKMIALISMFIDHTSAVFFEASPEFYFNQNLQFIDTVFRLVGRLAFPIYAFLLVEGFKHTSSVLKYALRLLIFALISEIPFNMANGAVFKADYQNTFFTLLLGLLMMWACSAITDHIKNILLSSLLQAPVVVAACVLADMFCCDYGYVGICVIGAIFFARNTKDPRVATPLSVAFVWILFLGIGALIADDLMINRGIYGIFSLTAFLPISHYSGQRGSFKHKYFFYVFYPAHLLLLGLIRFFILKY